MSILQSAKPFDTEQLNLLEEAIPPSVASWAANNPLVRESDGNGRLIKDLASIHTFGKAMLAKGRLGDFRFAAALGRNLNTQYPELQNYSPIERAGTAAGQLAVAKLLAKWYDLQAEDLERLPRSGGAIEFALHAIEFALTEVEGVSEAVGHAPQALGFSEFTTRNAYHQERFAAQEAVRLHGSTALEPFIAFPLFPIE